MDNIHNKQPRKMAPTSAPTPPECPTESGASPQGSSTTVKRPRREVKETDKLTEAQKPKTTLARIDRENRKRGTSDLVNIPSISSMFAKGSNSNSRGAANTHQKSDQQSGDQISGKNRGLSGDFGDISGESDIQDYQLGAEGRHIRADYVDQQTVRSTNQSKQSEVLKRKSS